MADEKLKSDSRATDSPERISIWFFIGAVLLVYGIIILIASIPGVSSPEGAQHVMLADLHAGIWWGALLIVLGAVYVAIFRPGRKKD